MGKMYFIIDGVSANISIANRIFAAFYISYNIYFSVFQSWFFFFRHFVNLISSCETAQIRIHTSGIEEMKAK